MLFRSELIFIVLTSFMSGENKIFNYISNRIMDAFDVIISIKKEIQTHKKFRSERELNNKKINNYEISKK